MKTKLLLVGFVAALLVVVAGASAQDFQITQVGKDAQGKAIIRHQADPAYYYILYRGTNIAQIISAVDMALGVSVEGELADGTTPPAVVFYRVRQVPIISPLDTDSDGIDDVWELRFRHPGAALNSNDANEDHTGSGTPDLQDYQLPIAYFLQSSNMVFAVNSNLISVTVHFSKAFTNGGAAVALVGGTAVYQQDYLITGFVASNQTARVPVVGQTATFTITLIDQPSIDPDRYLVLSILEPSTNSPARYQTSQFAPTTHLLRITEGDLGVYAGTLEFTNNLGSTSHSIRLALRSSQAGLADGYLDLTQSPFFQRAFPLPTFVSDFGTPQGFPNPVIFQTNAPSLQKSLNWVLNLGTVLATTNNTYEAAASISTTGLSASGQAVTANGLLRMVRVTP